MKHNRLVSFIKTPLFIAKEYLHRRPDPAFNWSFSRNSQTAQQVETLKQDGIVFLPGHFKGEALEKLRQAFDKAVEGRPNKHDPDSFINTEFLHEDPVFLAAAMDDTLLDIVGGYYQKKFSVGRASAMRLLPSEPVRYGSYQWHHDARGRQVHLMILLTEVPKDGQRMTYLKGSHHRFYDHYRGLAEGSRFEEDVQQMPDASERIVDVAGPAGTVAIFDANGLHSGNRNRTVTRDTVTYCYVTVRHFKKITCKGSDLSSLPPQKQEVMKFNPYCELVP